MNFETPLGIFTMLDEPCYSFGSADNTRQYPNELLLNSLYKPTSVHGVLLDDQAFLVLGDGGGCSGIHKHSLVFYNGAAYIAVGRHIAKIIPHPFSVVWILQVDDATCFGVHANEDLNALLSHGELDICRFSETGEILWSASGADIFSEGFSLLSTHVEAIDFNQNIYRFGYERGETHV